METWQYFTLHYLHLYWRLLLISWKLLLPIYSPFFCCSWNWMWCGSWYQIAFLDCAWQDFFHTAHCKRKDVGFLKILCEMKCFRNSFAWTLVFLENMGKLIGKFFGGFMNWRIASIFGIKFQTNSSIRNNQITVPSSFLRIQFTHSYLLQRSIRGY